jgi:hypothetical protein
MIETQTFAANRGHRFLLVFLGILMVAASIFVLWIAYQKYLTGNFDIKVVLAGVAGVLFFGLCLGATMQSLFQKGPALQIDADGVVLANYLCAVGRISWSNIRSTQIQTVTVNLFQKFDYLTIHVNDSEAVLRGIPKWKQTLLKSNVAYFSTPVFIGATDLLVPLEEVQLAIENALHTKRNPYHFAEERIARNER